MILSGATVKVVFDLDPQEWHGHATESLWANVTHAVGQIVCIENSPFFVRGVSYADSVRVEGSADVCTFVRIVQKSGYATLRVLIEGFVKKKRRVMGALKQLQLLDCRHEGGSVGDSQIFSIAVPPSTAARDVMAVIQRGCARDLWDAEVGDAGGRSEFASLA